MNKLFADLMVEHCGMGICPYCGGGETGSTFEQGMQQSRIWADRGGRFVRMPVPFYCRECGRRWRSVMQFVEGEGPNSIGVVRIESVAV